MDFKRKPPCDVGMHFGNVRVRDGMHPAFSGKRPKLFLTSYLDRSLPTSYGNCRSSLDPCYVMQQQQL